MRWLPPLRPSRPGPAAAVAEWMEPRLLFSADLAGGLLLAHAGADAGMEVRTLGADGEYASAGAAAAATPPADSQQQGAAASYAATGIAFEANQGQAPAGVDFSAWGSGYGVTLQGGHAAITLVTAEGTHRVSLQLTGAASGVAGEGEDLLALRSNHFVGQDASQWQSGIANYGAVRYRDVYDGIDVRYYGNQRQLEYDFIVAAGADAGAIGLRFDGVDSASIAANGDLVLQVEGGGQELRFRAPLSYQRGADGLETVASRCEIRADGSIGFVLGNYDRARELVIDPVLDYATYLGASGGESAVAVATDAAGYVYVTGRTTSSGSPFTGTIGSPGGAGDIFVAKLKPDLSQVVWATRIGGGSDEQGNAVAVDAAGNFVAVTGWTKSGNFPTKNADVGGLGLLDGQDAVVLELDGSGALRFSTYFGDGGADTGNAVAVDAAGNVYAAGEATEAGLLSGLLSPLLGGSVNAFVNKYQADGTAVYQQQLGGNGDDAATGIALGSAGDVYVVGTTRSGAWAIGNDNLAMNGAQATLSGSADGFLVHLDASAGGASYATFIGGNGTDSAAAVAVDGAGKAWVVGETRSGSSFAASAGAFITSLAGSNRDTGYLRAYDTTLAGAGSLRYSTFIGGSGVDHPTGVALAGSRVVVTGDAGSADLPLSPDAAQAANPGGALFLLVLNPQGSGASDLMYGTYYGASAAPGGVAVTGNQAVISGGTTSTGYGSAGTAQPAKSGGQDALIASFTLPNTAPVLRGLVQPGAILEDSGAGPGFAVSSLLAGQVLDLDAGALQGIAITGQDSSNGTWQYTTDGSTWNVIAGTSVSSALLLAADGQTRIRFVPAANFNGTVNSGLTLRAWDRTSGSAGGRADTSSNGGTTAFSTATQALNLTVTAVNDPPTTSGVVLTASNEDTVRTITAAELLANAADVDGDPLTVTNLAAGSGTLVNLGGGQWSFTPVSNDDTAVSFTYDIGDGTVVVAGTASLDLLPVNDAPTAVADAVQATLNTPVTYTAAALLGNDSDAEPGTLTIASVTSVSGGTAVLNANGTVTFTPAAGYAGNASFSYRVSDGALLSAPATVTVDINAPPVANGDALAATEDTPVTYTAAALLGNDTDADGDPLTIASVTSGSGGTAVRNADGTVTFTPNANFNGSAQFSYVAGDGRALSSPVTVNVNVAAVNDPPVAKADSFTIDEDQPFTANLSVLLANDTDVESPLGALSVVSVGNAVNGAVIDNGNGTFRFTPAANFSGTASFTYIITDGVNQSPPGTVTFTVRPVNDAPDARDDAFVGIEDTPLTFNPADLLANDSDAEGSPVAIVGVSGIGAVLNADGTITFTPPSNLAGPASFRYTISDGTLASREARVTINLTGVNDAPVAVADSLVAIQDTPVVFTAGQLLGNDTDVDGDVLTIASVASGTGGTAALNADGTVSFTPAGGFAGNASFTYTARDGSLSSAPVTVTVLVNDVPQARDDALAATEDTAATYGAAELLGNDLDTVGGPLAITGVGNASGGSVVLNADGTVTFTPLANFAGTGSFTYTAGDGISTSAAATVTISMVPVNDAPAGADQTFTMDEDGFHTFVAADFGYADAADGNNLAAVRITSVPTAGTLSHNGVAVTAGTLVSLADIAAGKLVFAPAVNGNGASYASFGFQVQDDGGTAGGGVDLDPVANTIAFDVTPVNDAPTGTDATITVNEDGSHTFVAADFGFTDAADGDALAAVRIASVPAAGTLTHNGVVATAGTVVSLADIAAGKLVFTPAANANGAAYASLTFQVQDDGGTAGGGVDLDPLANTITFNVTAVNDAPAGTDKTFAIDEDGSHTFVAADFGFSDATDGNSLVAVRVTTAATAGTLTIDGVAVTAGTVVSLADIAAGKLVFTPAANANGTAYASFRFQVQDDGGTAGGGVDLDPVANTITFDVAPVNDAPTGADATMTLDEEGSHTFSAADFGFTDVADGDALLAVRISTMATAGTLTINGVAVTAGTLVSLADIAAGKLVFTPAVNANGTGYASLRFQVQDDGGTAGGGVDLDPVANTITFNVTPVNDAPAGTDATITVDEDGSHTFAAADFGFSDAADGNSLAAVRITSVTTAGTLIHNGVAVTAGTLVSLADIAAGKLVYTPAANANGAAYAGFSFQVQDDGGTAGGGADLDPVANTITINVTALNDAPTGTDAAITIGEDGSHTFAAGDFGFADAVDGNNLAAVRITSVPTAGTLTNNGVAVTAGTLISAADIAAGKLVFTPAANANGPGYASFSFRVQDDGGTAGGGVDLDLLAKTITFNVTAVNDPPTGTDATITANEDGAHTFVAADFGFTDAADGDALAAVRITSVPAAGTLTHNGVVVTAGTVISLADIAAGKLVFTPAANANGTAYASFRFQVQDDGGTAAGGMDLDPVAHTITFNVTPVNDAPVAADVAAGGSEDAVSIPVTLGGSDVEDGTGLTVTLQGLPANGTLYTDAALTTVAVAGTAYASGSFYFVPAADFNGTAGFRYTVSDSEGLGDATPATATIAVVAINDAPVLTGAQVTVAEGGTVVLAPADLSVTDPDSGSITFTVSAVSGGIFQVFDGAAWNAATSFTSAQLSAGAVRFVDDGDELAPSFDVTVSDAAATGNTRAATVVFTSINDAPVAAPVTLPAMAEDGGAIVLTPAQLLQGASDADGGALAVTNLVASSGTLVARADGSWSYTPAADFNGAVNFTYSVEDGLASVAGSASLVVSAVNDAPVITSLDGAPAATVSVGENDASVATVEAGDVDNPRQDLVYTIAGGADAGLFAIDRATGALSFVRAPDFEIPTDADRDNLYQVVVEVSDGSLSDQQALSIRVADAGESAPEPIPPVTPPPGPTPPVEPPVHPMPPATPPAPAPAPAPQPPAPPPAPGHTSQSLQDALGPTPDAPVVPLNGSTLSFATPVARLLAEADAGRVLRTIVFDRGGLELISTQGQADLLLSRFGVAMGSDGARLEDLQRSLRSTAFTGELDRLRQAVREELDLDQSMAVSVASVSFGLSLVYILWLIRGGVLLGSYLSALPAWRILDPLPVLSRVDEEDESEEEPLQDDGQGGRNTLRGFG